MLADILLDIQENIWNFCSIDDLKVISLTCHQLNTSIQPLYTRVQIPILELEDVNFIHNENYIEKFKRTQFLTISSGGALSERVCTTMTMFTSLQQLSICCIDSDHVFQLLCRNLSSNLRELILLDKGRSSDSMSYLSEELSSLQILRLSFSLHTDTALFHIAAVTSLVEIDLNCCSYVTDKGIAYFSSLVNLNVLILTSCYRITGSGFHSLVTLPNLCKLNVSDTHINTVGFSKIAKLASVTDLNVSGCPFMNEKGFAFITSMLSLKKLDLCGGEEDLISETVFSTITSLACIETLIVNTDGLTQNQLRTMSALPSLRMIVIWCDLDPFKDLDLSIFESVDIVWRYYDTA